MSVNSLDIKEFSLRSLIKSYKSVLVAYSGGVDSSLLSTICSQELPLSFFAVISDSPSLSREDLLLAKSVANTMSFPLKIIYTQETLKKSYLDNHPNRCYICKSTLFSQIEKLRISLNFSFILDGNHAQDDPSNRKGMLAAKDQNVLSPFRICGINKLDIRNLAKKLGLTNWAKPSSPCMASRFPTGVKIEVDQFPVLEKIESICKQAGFLHIRARHHREILRLEIPPNQFQSFIQQSSTLLPLLRQFPYRHITLDLLGLRLDALL